MRDIWCKSNCYLKDEALLAKIGTYEFGKGPDFAVMEPSSM